jgi:hypothetical protein
MHHQYINKNLKYTTQLKVMCGLNEFRQPDALPVSNNGSLELETDFICAPSAFILFVCLKTYFEHITTYYV